MNAPAGSRMTGGSGPVLAATFAALMVASGLGLLAMRLTSPWDGLEWQQSHWGNAFEGAGWLVQPVGDAARVAPGEAVTAVNGQPIASIVRSPFDLVGLGSPSSLTYDVVSDAGARRVEQPLAPFPLDLYLAQGWPALVTDLGLFAFVAFIFAHRPRDPAAQLLLALVSVFAIGPLWQWVGINDIVAGPLLPVSRLIAPLTFLGYSAGILFPFVYPRPADWLVRHRRLVLALALVPSAAVTVGLLAAQLSGEPWLSWNVRLVQIEPATFIAGLGIWAVGVPVHFRHLRGADRRRYGLLIGSLLGAGGLLLLLWVVPSTVSSGPLLPWPLSYLLAAPVLAALAIGVLRLGAFELGVLLNRSLVYGALTISVALIYLVLVGGTMLVVQQEAGFVAAIVATVLAVVLVQPMRDALQRVVNRLMYGDRDDPYRALSRLGARIESSLAPRDVLTAVVDTVAEALRVPYVAVELETDDGAQIAAERGARSDSLSRLPLVHQGDLVGHLLVAWRAGEAENEVDQRLLTDLSRQAGPAAFAARAQDQLQRSRERLVAALEEERRRLRRELHDGLGPALAGSRLQLQAAQASLTADPVRTQRILEQIEAETREAIGEVRRMARDLRPPTLDELGLLAALRERATHFSAEGSLRVEVDAPDRLPALPAAVEVAAYRIALEAVANVVAHARAHRCRVCIELDGDLRVEVRDDGIGFERGRPGGVGLRSMRERADELGGTFEVQAASPGTIVVAHLPVVT